MEKKGFQISGWLVFSELIILMLSGVVLGLFGFDENILSCIIQLFTFIPVITGALLLKKIHREEKSKDLLGFHGFDITMLFFFLVLPYFAQKFALIAAAPANYILTEIFGTADAMSIPQNIPDFLWQLLSVCILAPLTEELLFRSVVFKLLSPFGAVTAVVISALMFSLLHVSPGGIIIIFAMGIVLGIIRYVSGSVFACMVFHAINNFYGIIETVFSREIEIMANTYVILSIVSAVLFIPVLLLYKKIYPQTEYYQKTQYIMGISVGFILTVLVFLALSFMLLLK